MTSRRLLKAAEAIREVVASAILTEIRDPRVNDVTVIGVEVTPDMREATVSVSVMGDEKKQNLTLRGLENSAGFLQSKIAKRIESRYTPKLHFELNKGVQNAMLVGQLLEKIRLERVGQAPAIDSSDRFIRSRFIRSRFIRSRFIRSRFPPARCGGLAQRRTRPRQPRLMGAADRPDLSSFPNHFLAIHSPRPATRWLQAIARN